MNTEDGINLVLFTEVTVSKLETVAAVSLGGTATLELFLALEVVKDKLDMADDETLLGAVLVINVEFTVEEKTEDDISKVALFKDENSVELLIDIVTFLEKTISELFTITVSVKRIEDGEIRMFELVMLFMLDDRTSVLLSG